MLGIALTKKLVSEGYTVYAAVRPDSPKKAAVPVSQQVKIIECDLSDMDSLPEKIGEKCEAFYHFAWAATGGAGRDDMRTQSKNIAYAVSAAEAAAKLGCEVFLGAGSQAEYGRKSEKLTSALSANPENGYGMAKLCAGMMTRKICQSHGVRHIWCRILSVYGPNDGANTMVMSGIGKMLKGERPSYTKAEQLWDYLYCDDAANAFYLAAKSGRDGAIYCVGSGCAIPLRDYILAIRDCIDPKLEVGIGELPYSEKQVMYLCADISELQKDVGFVPKYSFEDGIRETVEWYRSINQI
jgi:nucleoside-diphosphate-sugar epimerase